MIAHVQNGSVLCPSRGSVKARGSIGADPVSQEAASSELESTKSSVEGSSCSAWSQWLVAKMREIVFSSPLRSQRPDGVVFEAFVGKTACRPFGWLAIFFCVESSQDTMNVDTSERAFPALPCFHVRPFRCWLQRAWPVRRRGERSQRKWLTARGSSWIGIRYCVCGGITLLSAIMLLINHLYGG